MKKSFLLFQSPWWGRMHKPVAVMMSAGLLFSPVMAQQPPVPVPEGIRRPEAAAAEPQPAATPAPASAPAADASKTMQLNFKDTPIETVLEMVSQLEGRTIIRAPGVNATITLKSNTRLTKSEALEAIEAILAMNNITLVPMGDKFLRAVQTGQARQEGMTINMGLPEGGFRETDRLISQVFILNHIELQEIQPIIQSLLHGYGKIQPLERANSLMITDTEANLARITELLNFLDQPVEAKIETRIYEIRYAEASQVAGKLNELIADSQAKEERPQIAVQEAAPAIPTPPGVIRARQAQQRVETGEVEAAMQMAERGIVSGKVKIIADDRTNILFVISRLENFVFFDRIVDVLDRQIDPAITVRVVALEYAKADEISGILNEFIGAASASEESGAPIEGSSDVDGGATDSRSQALRDFIRSRTAQQPAPAAASGSGETSIGRLSADTKILADKRTNSLLMMGKLRDLSILEDLIDHLDIMLAQVVIEAVIIEVGLSDEIKSGVDWVQKSMLAYAQSNVGPGGGVSVIDPVIAWGGGTGLGAGTPVDATTITGSREGWSGGLSWYTSIFDLNIDAIIRMAQSSRDSQILSTPVIVTTDNTEAKIIASTQRPVVTTTVTSNTDSGFRSSYEYRDIGINLTVTPRINPQRMVVMEVNQTADDVAGEILIDGNPVPEITKRELNATVSVADRSTIVLGGLILGRNSESETKIPFLGDIPVLGRLFKFKSNAKQRSELVVLLTPYVLMTPAEARAESTRLYSANSSRQKNWHTGWSDSPLGKMTDREKANYVKEWDNNRPAPYTRDLSINVWSDEPSSAPGAVEPPAVRRENIVDIMQAPDRAPEVIEAPVAEETVVEEAPATGSAPPTTSIRLEDLNRPMMR